MKIKKMSSTKNTRKYIVISLIVLAIIAVAAGIMFAISSKDQDQDQNPTDSSQSSRSENNTTAKTPDQTNTDNDGIPPESVSPADSAHDHHHNSSAPSSEPEPEPELLITDFSTKSNVGTVSYTANIQNAKSNRKCVFTLTNEAGKNLSVTTDSKNDTCSGEIKDSSLVADSSWTANIRYKDGPVEAIARKLIKI